MNRKKIGILLIYAMIVLYFLIIDKNRMPVTVYYPARYFGMYMAKYRDIQDKMPSTKLIWNTIWVKLLQRS